jgi:hypothetical protein
MENELRLREPQQYVHVIVDDDDRDSSRPEISTSDVNMASHYHQDRGYAQYHHYDSQERLQRDRHQVCGYSSRIRHPREVHCCCFSSSAIPNCCVVAAFTNASLGLQQREGILRTEIAAFQKAVRITRSIGSSVIKRQAASINRRLLELQQGQANLHDCEQTKADEDMLPYSSKRQRTECNAHCNRQVSHKSNESIDHDDEVSQGPTTASASSTSSTKDLSSLQQSSPTSFENAAHIWEQVDRMKRMSMFLKNAQLAQNLLLEEINDCLEDERQLDQPISEE